MPPRCTPGEAQAQGRSLRSRCELASTLEPETRRATWGGRRTVPRSGSVLATEWPASKLARAVGACSDLRLPVSASLEIELHTTAPRHVAFSKAM